MLIGAHVSTAGGVEKSVGRAVDIGAECIQIFASSPRGWAFKPIPEGSAKAFREGVKKHRLGPTVLHAVYLVAPCTSDSELLNRSTESLTLHLRAAEQLGALGLIFHAASHRGRGLDAVMDQFVACLRKVLDEAPGDAMLMIENSAGSGDHVGSKFSDIGRVLKEVNNPRMGVCLDTQHAYAAGYDVSDRSCLDNAIAEFDLEIGLTHLKAVHANDSKKQLGSAVDRHDNIGEGLIGRQGFKNIMRHRALAEVPFYLEVPGFGDKPTGPDRENVTILKSIREEAASRK